MTHDGVILGEADPAEGAATLDLIARIIGDISRNSKNGSGRAPQEATPQAEPACSWHDDMIWWGPEGVGAAYTIDRYIAQHQQPFRQGLTNRIFNGHLCRLAEGNYGGFLGWPNLTLTPVGGFMGLPAGPTADMGVVDIYRRDGDMLAENGVFIDMLHVLKMQGLYVLARLAAGR